MFNEQYGEINKLAYDLVAQIVEGRKQHGWSGPETCVLLESVVLGVLLYLLKTETAIKHADEYIDMLSAGLRERFGEVGAEHLRKLDPEGTA